MVELEKFLFLRKVVVSSNTPIVVKKNVLISFTGIIKLIIITCIYIYIYNVCNTALQNMKYNINLHDLE